MLRITLDEKKVMRATDCSRDATIVEVFAPAILDVTAVSSDRFVGYVHLTGPFHSGGMQWPRRNLRAFGPYPIKEVDSTAAVLRRYFGLPVAPTEVSYDNLMKEPARYHNRIIRSYGPWRRLPGRSQFAGAWLSPPDRWNTYGSSVPRHFTGSVVIDVVGLWRLLQRSPNTGRIRADHRPAVLEPYLLEVLGNIGNEGAPQPDELPG